MLKKVVLHSVATALASIVLPVPGGPNMSTPCTANETIINAPFSASVLAEMHPVYATTGLKTFHSRPPSKIIDHKYSQDMLSMSITAICQKCHASSPVMELHGADLSLGRSRP